MAESNWPDQRETIDVLDFGGYHTNDDNNENGIRNTPFVSAGQKKTPSIRRENDTNIDTGYTYPTTVSSAPEPPTVEASINTTGTTPVVPVEQMATPSIRPEDDLHIEFGSTNAW